MAETADADTLPDLLTFEDGSRVADAADWPRRRQELLEAIQRYEYGHLPPARPDTTALPLIRHRLGDPEGVAHSHHRLVVQGQAAAVSFTVELFVPAGQTPRPAVICGDGCWTYIDGAIVAEVVGRGVALAVFNRTEVAPDLNDPDPAETLYAAYPGGDFGALAAWAWGFHRCVDFLLTREDIDPARIAVAGHSRGGKASLLAGATDERIALTVANNSGCGGAGCFRAGNEGSERLADILKAFPAWFTPSLRDYVGRDEELPIDQHFLKALVAPRSLLTTEALGDLWANPVGTWHTHQAACEVYRFCGAEECIGIHYRQGGHRFGLEDWQTLLDFLQWRFEGRPPTREFDKNPFI